MKFFWVLIVTSSFIFNLHAQDVIILHAGDEIECEVTEVLPNTVKYRAHDNLGGPVYTINKNEIFMIKYESGTKDMFQVNMQNTTEMGLATFYFFRPKKFASGKPKIIVGTVEPDEVILKLKNGSWYKTDYAHLGERQFAAGVYVINPELFDLDVNPGETYYIRCTVFAKGMKIMAQMEMVEESVAQKEMLSLKEQTSSLVN